MNQFFFGIIVILSLGCWWLWQENETLKANNIALEGAVAVQEETIATLQTDFAKQGQSLNELTMRNNEIEMEMNRYLDIFKRHNLTKLAFAKPGLIETRANNATKEVFDGIEADSRSLDELDNGIQLQSTTQNPKD
tara:strand:+ start:302 stop:709 length:408 start_codon:yes stop_codon:yes gene_type:complete